MKSDQEKTKDELLLELQSLRKECESWKIKNLEDQSAHSTSEQELRSTISLLNATLESTADAILVMDLDRNVVSYNRNFLELWAIVGEKVDKSVLKHIAGQISPYNDFKDKVVFLFDNPGEKCLDAVTLTDRRVVEYFTQPRRIGNEIVGRVWSFRDITERKQIDNLETELLNLSSYLVAIPYSDINKAIEIALGKIGQYFSADRAYIFEFDSAYSTASNTHEWCKEGIRPDRDNLQNIPCDLFPKWMESLSAKEPIVIASVDDLPDEWTAEKEILKGIKSVIIIPLINNGVLVGFVGLDDINNCKTYRPGEINLLRIWGDMLGSLVSNNKISKELQRINDQMTATLKAIPDLLFKLDRNGVFLDYHGPEEFTLIAPPEEFIGKNINRFLPQDICDNLIPLFEKAIETNLMQSYEYSLVLGGQTRYFESRIVAKENENIICIVRDHTEKKLSEEMLKQTKKNYESFFNTLSELLFILDEQGNILQANKTVYDRLGYSSEELLGQSVLMVHPPDRREEALEIVTKMILGQTKYCPVPVITKSGSLIPVETRVMHGQWDGKPVLFGVTKDISEIKFSEEKFSKVFYVNPSACSLTDMATGKFIEVNNMFYKIFGFDIDEVIGRSITELGIMTQESFTKVMSEADDKGNVTNVEVTLKAKNGNDKNVLLSSENITIQDKKYRYTVAHDITELKRFEEALEIERRRLSDILEGTNVGTWEWNIQTGETVFNERWANIMGYTLEELAPLSIETWVKACHPDDLVQSGELLNKHFEGITDYYEFEARMRHKNGNWVWVLDRGKVHTRDSEGKPLFMSGTHQDITKRKTSEENFLLVFEELKASKRIIEENLLQKNSLLQDLEKTNTEKDKFFSIIAHDLRSPFSGFLGLTQYMAEKIQDLTLGEIQSLGITMKEQATNLFKLLENLLEWSRVQRGIMEFTPVVCSVNQIVDYNIGIISGIAKHKNIELTSVVGDSLLIKADMAMINTIIRNLVSNAVKFTPEGGKVEVGAFIPPAGSLVPENQVVISIKDSGIGMDSQMKDKLFKIDKKVSRPGTNNEPSTGLGLILCKEFVDKHSGSIWVESEENRGTTFFFSVPVADKDDIAVDLSGLDVFYNDPEAWK